MTRLRTCVMTESEMLTFNEPSLSRCFERRCLYGRLVSHNACDHPQSVLPVPPNLPQNLHHLYHINLHSRHHNPASSSTAIIWSVSASASASVDCPLPHSPRLANEEMPSSVVVNRTPGEFHPRDRASHEDAM